MKKILVLTLLVLMLTCVFVGCEQKTTPDPAVVQFLNNGMSAQKAYDTLTKVSYVTTITVQNKKGELLGTEVTEVHFDLTDKQNLTMQMLQSYTGERIVDGVLHRTVTLARSEGSYVYHVVTNKDTKDEVLEDEVAEKLVKSLVFVESDAYNGGGLYYGDLFMLRIYKFPAESFKVDEENNLCVFDEKMRIVRDGVGDVKLFQVTKINDLGMMVYDSERYESVDEDYVMICETIPTYGE